MDVIPGYLEWKVSIGQQKQSRNKNSAQNSSHANKRELLVSTFRHRVVNRDAHCLSDEMWADSKHVGIQTCRLSVLSPFHSAAHPSNTAKRNDEIKSTVSTKGWVGGGRALLCLCSTDPELALIAVTHRSLVVELWLILLIRLISTRYHLGDEQV